MTTLRPSVDGGFGRGAPARRGPAAYKRWALLVTAALALGSGGCANLNFGRCGASPCEDGCGGGSRCRLFSGAGNHFRRLFRRDVVVTEPGCDAPIGAPVVEGATVVPGAVIPAPAADPGPTELAPAGTTSSASPNKKTLFETLKPNGGTTTSSRREAPLASRPAGAVGQAFRPTPAVAPEADDPLVNLPPLNPSVEKSPPESTDVEKPAATASPPANAAATDAKSDTTPTPVPTAASASAVTPGELPEKPSEGLSLSIAPGFQRFKVIDRQLAAGSAPAEAGWSFLTEKGYRTVLDLRDRGEVSSADIAAADHAGLRYVALPITPQTIDASHVRRFQEELALAENRPLYVFDVDGSRAAVMWYIKQVAVDRVDPRDAAREAEEIGPKDSRYWVAAATYLESLKATPAPAPSSPAAGDPPAPSTPAPEPDAPKSSSAPIRSAIAAAEGPMPSDPNAWRPYAALAAAGLGVPLAFMSRSVIGFRPFSRAALPAPARGPKALRA